MYCTLPLYVEQINISLPPPRPPHNWGGGGQKRTRPSNKSQNVKGELKQIRKRPESQIYARSRQLKEQSSRGANQALQNTQVTNSQYKSLTRSRVPSCESPKLSSNVRTQVKCHPARSVGLSALLNPLIKSLSAIYENHQFIVEIFSVIFITVPC